MHGAYSTPPPAPSLLRKEGVFFISLSFSPSPQGLSQRTLRLHGGILQGPLAGDPAGTEKPSLRSREGGRATR